MSHRNARLTFHGRLLLVERIADGQPVSHAAKAAGVSRQCATKWRDCFDAEGLDGLHDRTSRPHLIANQTSPEVEEQVLAARREYRCGPDLLCHEVDVPARTITRILRRNGVPRIHDCDPMTGELIRASKTTAVRYQRDRPGERVHVDVKMRGPRLVVQLIRPSGAIGGEVAAVGVVAVSEHETPGVLSWPLTIALSGRDRLQLERNTVAEHHDIAE
jgi:hypothetical protein